MSIRRGVAYLGLFIGLILLVWGGLVRYPVEQGDSKETMIINGYSVVREAARDGLKRDKDDALVKRSQESQPKGKDAETCYT